MEFPRRLLRRHVWLFVATTAALTSASADAQHGTILSAAGAVNRSMGGAATAAPLGATGALYWNAATITGLPRSELEVGAELLFVDTVVATRLGASTLGPGIPPVGLQGSTVSDTGGFALPTVGLAYLPEGSDVGFGLGIFPLAGFGVNYAGGGANPLLSAPPPTGVGFGPIYSEYQVLQIHPALAWRLNDRLSVSAGPSLDLAFLRVSPFLVAAPDDADGDGFATYPGGLSSETTYGGGFDLGVYWRGDVLSLGASYKSPQWFDTLRYNSADELGRPRRLNYQLNLPAIVSVGAAFTGIERWTLAVDARYLDYAATKGFGDVGFGPDGALRGLGWKSIFAVAAGVEHRLTDRLALRAGYSWNDNPIGSAQATANVVAPLVVRHMGSVGASWQVTDDFALSAAYLHAFESSVEGPLATPFGPAPDTSVRNTASGDSVTVGATVKFGGSRNVCRPCGECGSIVTPQ
jgi:long-chain fatty acid transport protein